MPQCKKLDVSSSSSKNILVKLDFEDFSQYSLIASKTRNGWQQCNISPKFLIFCQVAYFTMVHNMPARCGDPDYVGNIGTG